ncbi:alkene reductase [Rhodospirillum centenum]|uniref:Morphinone reductase n=1 Tax=Rhodospirillum centenum (strain ATCC 51521 / SW) TaxID=414684 RepID=B6IUZ4_RHOCS|nr:alkene reductase [Rhodospirillum centenum]ACJ00076.1 morphinone reductase [Rhodospirillum centenum SW]
MSDTTLFTPVRLGALDLPNRLVMAPLTRSRAVAGNVPNPLAVTYYRQRATAGLIIAEATQVTPEGQGYPDTPGLHTDAQVAGWRAVTDAVHEAGGRIVVQLWHVGRVSHQSYQPGGALPVAPSAISPGIKLYTHQGLVEAPTPRALEIEEIPGIVGKFAAAAARAREAGFDGVEIHAANGYLIDQFLRSGSNARTDAYGGSVENRARLLLEVTAAVTDVLGGDRVGVRLSPTNAVNGMSDADPAATFGHAAAALNRFGLAYLHVIEPLRDDHPMSPKGTARVSRQLRQAFTGPYIVNGGYDKATATRALADGQADAVAFGVPFIANPDLVERYRLDAPLNAADPATFYGGGEKGYTDYPFLSELQPV